MRWTRGFWRRAVNQTCESPPSGRLKCRVSGVSRPPPRRIENEAVSPDVALALQLLFKQITAQLHEKHKGTLEEN